MRVLDLFSGIGGFSLGLERAGMRTVAFCEIDPFCRRVLAKHWPGVPCYDDVRSLTAERLAADGITADVICGGFPCQDISIAGDGKGIDGDRSGLWSEYARIIGELRPSYVIVENVAALLGRGLDRVLGNLAALGYDAEWHCIPASALGAEHERDRVWIIANPDALQELQPQGSQPNERGRDNYSSAPASNADAARYARRLSARANIPHVANLEPRLRLAIANQNPFPGKHRDTQPFLGRGVHGVPYRVDRIGSLGNAVVPQIPEIIGRAIMSASKPPPPSPP